MHRIALSADLLNELYGKRPVIGVCLASRVLGIRSLPVEAYPPPGPADSSAMRWWAVAWAAPVWRLRDDERLPDHVPFPLHAHGFRRSRTLERSFCSLENLSSKVPHTVLFQVRLDFHRQLQAVPSFRVSGARSVHGLTWTTPCCVPCWTAGPSRIATSRSPHAWLPQR